MEPRTKTGVRERQGWQGGMGVGKGGVWMDDGAQGLKKERKKEILGERWNEAKGTTRGVKGALCGIIQRLCVRRCASGVCVRGGEASCFKVLGRGQISNSG
jgi:hypothetical protein